MVRVPIWEPNLSDLPGASKTPHSTGDSFGEQVGVAQQQAGAQIQKGFNELGSALTAQQDEQDAIKAKVAASDHETQVNLETLRLQTTTPASEAARIPDMVQEFAKNNWAQVSQGIAPKYRSVADGNVQIFHNNLYLKNQQQSVKGYYDAVTTQIKSEVERQGMSVFANPDNIHAATGAIGAYVNETTLPPDLKRQALVEAASNLQSNVLAGYKLRIQNAAATGNVQEALRLQSEAAAIATQLPGQLTDKLGINRLPPPAPPQIMQPGAPLPRSPGTGRRSDAAPGERPQLAAYSQDVQEAGPTPVEKGNIDVSKQPQVKNADGSISTVRSISFTDKNTGEHVLIPTVTRDGDKGGRIMTEDEAIQRYRDTGQHLGKFKSDADADAAGKALSKQEGKRIAPQASAAPQKASLTVQDQGDVTSGKPIEIAASILGTHEVRNRQVISDFIGRVGGQKVDPATTAWCAGFVNAVLRKSGNTGTDSLAARSFVNYGTGTNDPQKGDIVVFSRGPGHGHVGFYVGKTADGRIQVLGGNQGDKVSIQTYGTDRVIAYRRINHPNAAPARQQVAGNAVEDF